MEAQASWQPHTEFSNLENADPNDLPMDMFAFPKQRRKRLTDADSVRNALAQFDEVEDASDADRDLAFANIKKAAAYYGVHIEATDWRYLGKRSPTYISAYHRS
jgi:hypothetical protein